MLFQAGVGLLLVLVSGLSAAGEWEFRKAINDSVKAAIQRGDFDKVERDYAEAAKKRSRTPAGTYVTAHIGDGIRDANALGDEAKAEFARLATEERRARTDKHWLDMQARAQRWVESKPRSSLAAVSLVEAHIGRAFLHRGTGWSKEVGPEQWKVYNEEIEKAVQVLASKQLERDLAWYAQALRLLNFTGVETAAYAGLVEEAVEKYPYSYDVYLGAVPRMLPRWGGSPEAVEWLAQLALKNTRKQESSAAYARVYWGVSGSYDDAEFFKATLVEWPKMKKGFEDMVRGFPEAWNYNAYAKFACAAGDKKALKQALAKMGDQVHLTIWGNPARLTRCRGVANDAE